MSTPVSTATEWQWPADVLEFAAANKVRPFLDPLLETTRQVFPTSRSLRVYLQEDPEIQDDWHIIFEVQVPKHDLPSFVEAVHQWNRETLHCCPAPVVNIFVLFLRRVG